MIVRITGTIIDVGDSAIVVERGGIAREVLVPQFSIGELAANRGNSVTLHTLEFFEGNMSSGQMIPRIVGFLHAEDRLFFQRFTDVKGMGTRKALKALTQPVRQVAGWIESGDGKSLTSLPGIGARAADLMIASLRGKLAGFAAGELPVMEELACDLSQSQRDALEVLVSWGDSRRDAEVWMQRAAQLHPDLATPEEIVRCVYRIKSGAQG